MNNPSLHLETAQKQVLNTSLLTSLRILRMTNTELENYIQTLSETNPLIDFSDFESSSGSLAVRTDFFDETDLHASKKTLNASSSTKDLSVASVPDTVSSRSITQDLMLQVSTMELTQEESVVLHYLILSLDERGFLTDPVEEIATSLRCDISFVKQCVSYLKQLDPPGIGALNVTESLLLQLHRSGKWSETLQCLVTGHLDDLAKKNYRKLARSLRVSESDIRSCLDVLRSLSPYPINGLPNADPIPYVLPEVIVRRDGDTLVCEINSRYAPKVVFTDSYLSMMNEETLEENVRKYLSGCFSEAKEISRLVEYRASTIQRIVEYLLEKQRPFFLSSGADLNPVSNHDIAEALGLSDSTVSRAINGKYLEFERGVIPIRSLLSHNVMRDPLSDAISSDLVITKMRDIIAKEPAGKAYSDEQIARLLLACDISISRRTVAKYRDILEIPGSACRNRASRP